MLILATYAGVGAAFFVAGHHDRLPVTRKWKDTNPMNPNAATKPNADTTARPLLSPEEMSDTQLADFFAKGPIEKPVDDGDTPSADQPAESAPADAVDSAASTDASHETASETVKPEKKAKGRGVTERNEQLRAEIEENTRLLRQRRELREALAREDAPAKPKADATKPDSSPAAAEPTEADFKRYLAMPGAPKAEQFDGDLDGYTAAMGTFIAKQIAKESFDQMFTEREQRSAAQSAELHELNDAITTAEERAKADEARDPDWRDKLDPAFAAIPPARMLPPGQKPHVMHFIKDQVMFESEHPCSLSVYMSTPEGKQWAASLMRLRPERIVREIAIKDASFGSAPDDEETTTSLVSAAPQPGPTLGRKPSKPVDPLKAAIDSNDPESFIEQRNRAVVGAGKR